jgi:hypothetical protein
VILSIGGLAAILGLMALMRQAFDFSRGQIAGFTVVGFVIVLAAEILFIWLLVRSLKGVQASHDDGRPGSPIYGRSCFRGRLERLARAAALGTFCDQPTG